MMRCFSLFRATAALVPSVMLACCVSNPADAPNPSTRSHAYSAPQNLPEDFVAHSAPTPPPPPPNHDGGLTHDAGRDADTAVPFKEALRDGRIAENDDGDAWLLEGAPGQVLSIALRNRSEDVELAYELRDHDGRQVVHPPPQRLRARESVQHTIEIPRGESAARFLLLITADAPLSYDVRSEIL